MKSTSRICKTRSAQSLRRLPPTCETMLRRKCNSCNSDGSIFNFFTDLFVCNTVTASSLADHFSPKPERGRAQHDQPAWILRNAASIDRSGNRQVVVPVNDLFLAGAFAALLEQLDGILAFGP